MIRNLLLVALLGLAIAGGYNRGRTIDIRAGQRCVINFGCGAYGTDGSPTAYSRARYSYNFAGLPSWLSASGSSISGTPPSGQTGPWYVTVNYQGAGDSGSTDVALTCNGASSGSRVGIGALPGSAGFTLSSAGYSVIQTLRTTTTVAYSEDNSGYFVLVPILTDSTRTVYDKQPDTLITNNAISCADQDAAALKLNADLNNQQVRINDLKKRIADLQAALDKINSELAGLQPAYANTQDLAAAANRALDNCRRQAAAVPAPVVVSGGYAPRTETVSTVSYLRQTLHP